MGRDLAFAICDGGHVPVVVVAVGFRVEQRIFSRPCSVHVVVGIDRLLAFRIRDGEQIAIGVIRERGISIDRIRELRDAVQGIRRIEGFLSQGIRDIPQPPRGIQNPLRLAIERIFDLDEVAEFIGQGRHVGEGIGDRERLALRVDGNRGGLTQGIRDGREIAFGVVAERGRVA